ncbi:MAG: hypothetical protein MJZ61_05955 [Bacteroidales bacterium]|nr:hypothetical protein [Bacteroidales bacterium]
MKKTFILAASLLLCACGGQQNQNQQNAEKTIASEVQKEEPAAEEVTLDEATIKHNLKEKYTYNYVHFEDIDGDGKNEIFGADFDPAEGGIIYGMGVFLNDKDLTCVANYKGDRMDIGVANGVVVKMTLDDDNKENFEIFQIKNSKATPAPEGTAVPDYKSLTSYDIESWEETYDF